VGELRERIDQARELCLFAGDGSLDADLHLLRHPLRVVTTICDIVTLMYSDGGLPPFFRFNVSFEPRDATPRAISDRPPHQFDAVWHAPVVGLHTSVVHGLPSLQTVVLVVWHCPVTVLQASLVHRLRSLQVTVP
jgi:hypothetical protein